MGWYPRKRNYFGVPFLSQIHYFLQSHPVIGQVFGGKRILPPHPDNPPPKQLKPGRPQYPALPPDAGTGLGDNDDMAIDFPSNTIDDEKDYLPPDESFRNMYAPQHKSRRLWKRKRGRKRKYAKISKALYRTINRIAKKAQNTSQFYTKKEITFGQASTQVNESQIIALGAIGATTTIEADMNAVAWEGWFDTTGNPAFTLATENITIVKNMTIPIVNIKQNYRFRNNWSLPGYVECWYLIAKKDGETGMAPLTLIDGGYRDKYQDFSFTNGPQDTDEMHYYQPTEFLQFNVHWKVYKHSKHLINPGEVLDLYHQTGRFNYNVEQKDANANIIYIGGVTKIILLRLKGVIAHDSTTTTEVGIADCKLDYQRFDSMTLGVPRVAVGSNQSKVSATYNAMAAGAEADLEHGHGDDVGVG